MKIKPATDEEIAAVLQAFETPGEDISQEEMELEINAANEAWEASQGEFEKEDA